MIAQRVIALALAPYAAWLVFGYEYHFLDGVNLAFHEAGHVFLTPLGLTLHVMGGTLLQLAVPLIFAGHFLREGKRFEPWVCLFWFGESLMYTAFYMSDAARMELPLVGGGEIHDWNWLLSKAGVLRHCRVLSGTTHVLASTIVLASLAMAFRSAFGSSARETRGHDAVLATLAGPKNG